jgi:(2Fe-2S) ferredoxin
MAERKHYLFVCINRRGPENPKGSCAGRGSIPIHTALKAAMKDAKLADYEVRTCTSSCLDTCWAGPTIAVEPDGFFYGRVKLEDVPEIVEAFRDGRRVERLVLPPNDFDEKTAGPSLPTVETPSSATTADG